MKEYRIQAYFKEALSTRTYKRKIFNSLEEAERVLPEAREYYSGSQYLGRLDRAVIESRTVDSWKAEETEAKKKPLKELALEYINKGIETVLEVEWWWSSYKSWRDYFNCPDSYTKEELEETGRKFELDSEYSFKGSAKEFLEYSEQYECLAEMEGQFCEEFTIEKYLDSKGHKGGIVIFAKYVEEVSN